MGGLRGKGTPMGMSRPRETRPKRNVIKNGQKEQSAPQPSLKRWADAFRQKYSKWEK